MTLTLTLRPSVPVLVPAGEEEDAILARGPPCSTLELQWLLFFTSHDVYFANVTKVTFTSFLPLTIFSIPNDSVALLSLHIICRILLGSSAVASPAFSSANDVCCCYETVSSCFDQ